MAEDYIPRGDAELLEFAQNFVDKIDGNEAYYGLKAADSPVLTERLDSLRAAYNNYNAVQTTVQSALRAKDAERTALVAQLRSLARTVQKADAVTNAKRADLQITIPDSFSVPDGPPQSRPAAEIDTSEPLRHTVKFYDLESEGRGKPPGVRGAEIWCKTDGAATMNEEDYRYLGTDTASPYLAVHKPENVGKQAHYLLRWVNTRGEYGAWSNPVSATITG